MNKYKMNKKSGVLDKILGTIVFGIGLVIGYVEYTVISAITVIGTAIAGFLGIEGAASTGIVIITCIPVIGVIIGLAVLMYGLFWVGYKLFTVGW